MASGDTQSNDERELMESSRHPEKLIAIEDITRTGSSLRASGTMYDRSRTHTDEP